jgi:type IV pilus assembly protein PilE
MNVSKNKMHKPLRDNTLMYNKKGFTLTELLITVAILGILSMIALPAYQSQGQKTRRADAKIALTNAAQALERCNIQYDAYNSGSCSQPLASDGATVTTDEGFYTIAAAVTTTTFSLTATPVAGGGQADDSRCTSFTINQAGTKTATGSSSSDCW